MATITVGRFSHDPTTGTLTGPAAYMREQGDAYLAETLAGKNEAFNRSAHFSPNVETALLVYLQTDYAAWAGARDLMRSFGR
jgi:hypothetical protein